MSYYSNCTASAIAERKNKSSTLGKKMQNCLKSLTLILLVENTNEYTLSLSLSVSPKPNKQVQQGHWLKLICFYIIASNTPKMKLRKVIPFMSLKKNEILYNKSNKYRGHAVKSMNIAERK